MKRLFTLLAIGVLLPLFNLQAAGGEDCTTATVIPGLPFTDTGNNSTALDDYDEVCGFFGNTGGQDQVYEFTPTMNMVVDINLCGGTTDFDTKLYVYENACPVGGAGGGTVVACSEDECANPPLFTNSWISRVTGVSLLAGNTYYIVVDAYGGADVGDYTISMLSTPGDAFVSQILTPGQLGCNLSAAEPVAVDITNAGTAISEVYVFLEVDGVVIETDTLPTPIPNGGTITHVFNNTADLSAPGAHVIRAAASAPMDGDPFNDTLTLNVDNLTATALPLPILDFTAFNGGNLDVLYPGWFEANGALPAFPNPGFGSWTSSNAAETAFLGSETAKLNLYSDFHQDWIISPLFNVAGALELRFDAGITVFGGTGPSSMGSDDSVQVLGSNDCGQTWFQLLVFDVSNQPGNGLSPYSVSLAGFTGQDVILAFYGTDGPVDDTEDYNFHLDNVQLIDPTQIDVAAGQLLDPMSSDCSLSAAEAVTVTIDNLAIGIPELYAELWVDGVQVVVDTVTGPFAGNSTVTHTFTQTGDFSAAGNHDVVVVATTMGDIGAANDTGTYAVFNILPLNFPQPVITFDGFTGGNLGALAPGWYTATGAGSPGLPGFSGWAGNNNLGQPTARVNIWNFGGSDNWMVSPLVTPGTDTRLRFDMAVTNFFNSTPGLMDADDSLNVMVSTDCGANWQIEFVIDSLNQPTNVLTPFEVDLSGYAGQDIYVAFYTRAGNAGVSDLDFHLDNISLNNFFPIDIGVTSFVTPASGCDLTTAEVVSVEFVHFGTDTVFGPAAVPLAYTADGTTVITDTFFLSATDTLPPGDTVLFPFSTPVDLSVIDTNYSIVAWTDLGDPQASNDTFNIGFRTYGPAQVSMGLDANYCADDDTLFAMPTYRGGTWSGLGIVDSANGGFNPSLVGVGNTTTITYLFEDKYGVVEVPFAPQTLTNNTTVNLFDDDFSTAIPIGFDFEFFGETYSDFFIGSNGIITFGEGSGSLGNQTLPDPAAFAPNNLIAFAWDDLDPNNGIDGTISYELMGTAPNRMMVVSFEDVPHFPGGAGAPIVNIQTILHESTNEIEMQVTRIETDNGGMTQGIEDADGAFGYATTDSTNNQPFTQDSVAYLFVPTPCPGADTLVITIGPDLPFAGGSAALCDGQSTDLDALNPGGTYVWSTGDTTQTITVTATGQYYVDIVSADGCVGSDTVDVVLVALPTLTLDSINTPLCAGDSNGAVFITPNGNGPFSTVWSTGDSTEDISGVPAGTYTVISTDANGCIVENNTVTVTQPDSISATATVLDVQCDGDSTGSIDLTPTGGTAPYTFMWSNGSMDEDPSGLPVGSYTGMITDANGCMLESAPIAIVATDSAPSADFSFTQSGGIITFTNTGTSGATYDWQFGDVNGSTSTDENPAFAYPADGNYSVTLITSNDCGADTATLTLTGINGLDFSSQLAVAPNPTKGSFTLTFGSDILDGVNLRLVDMNGKEVYVQNFETVSQGFAHTIELAPETARGVYLLKVRSQQGVGMIRVIVE